eukprot:COSAG06_NODE_39381_length_412_cov_0.894904_1_plen_46_part_10
MLPPPSRPTFGTARRTGRSLLIMADRQQPLLYAGGAKTARGTAGLE